MVDHSKDKEKLKMLYEELLKKSNNSDLSHKSNSKITNLYNTTPINDVYL